jgi:hypothetical protein
MNENKKIQIFRISVVCRKKRQIPNFLKHLFHFVILRNDENLLFSIFNFHSDKQIFQIFSNGVKLYP